MDNQDLAQIVKSEFGLDRVVWHMTEHSQSSVFTVSTDDGKTELRFYFGHNIKKVKGFFKGYLVAYEVKLNEDNYKIYDYLVRVNKGLEKRLK